MRKLGTRLLIGFLFAIFGLISYYGNVDENPVTGEMQRVRLSPQQEIALGLQARNQMAAQHGGLYPDNGLQIYIDEVGQRVVAQSEARESPYKFEFHLLRDPQTVNAFALPGGQIFITAAMLDRLNSEAQLAGVLGHEVGHVVGRHGAEHLAKQQLGAILVTAVDIAATDESGGGRQATVLAQAINQMVGLKYGRDDELESDRLGLRFMVNAGYDPEGIVELMQILEEASGGNQPPEFLSTHPNPGNRVGQLQQLIAATFPNGIPSELEEGEERFAQIVPAQL